MTAFGYVISQSLLALVLVWIAGIAAALTRKVMACVTWVRRGRQGEIVGAPQSSHMQALLLRALREGVTVSPRGRSTA